MQDRPEHTVGETVVVFLEISAREIGGDIGDAAMLDLAERLFALRTRPPAPTEPEALVALEERADHDLQAARARTGIPVRDGNAIGYDHYARHDPTSPLRSIRRSSCAPPKAP